MMNFSDLFYGSESKKDTSPTAIIEVSVTAGGTIKITLVDKETKERIHSLRLKAPEAETMISQLRWAIDSVKARDKCGEPK